MKVRSITIFLFLIALLFCVSAYGQGKKNSRPNSDSVKKQGDTKKIDNSKSVYFYEFSQPDFMVSEIKIEHDENGVGQISFKKRDYEDFITEPLELSESTLGKLKEIWTALNFLDSDEVYQSKERDYGHLGNMKFKMRVNKRERSVGFNWTENKDAKVLANEYRKIGNQFVWLFDMKVARENQPLESPKIIKNFDKMLQRNEISDPKQLIPFLQDVSDDERFPLITRNHASRILKKLEKAIRKSTEKN